MTGQYHEGEIAVQMRAGAREMADRVGRIFNATIKPEMREFFAHQRLIVVSSIAPDGTVWASVLTGEAGFITVQDEQTVRIAAMPELGDPLIANIAAHPAIGTIIIDLATRQRVRLNGVARMQSDGSIVLTTEQIYGNCQQYIQQRARVSDMDDPPEPSSTQQYPVLTDAHQRWIAEADTFFIASAHPEHGADASHRGGAPGFVRVINQSTLVWPDYSGNKMFNTLGNLAVNPHTGLLFIDFVAGRTLQLTGTARIVWDADRIAAFVGAERLVEFTVDAFRETTGIPPLRRRLVAYSRFNPVD